MNRKLHKLCSKKFFRNSQSHVSTLSPLATKVNQINTPSLESESVGLFGIPELKSSEGFSVLKDTVLTSANNLVNNAINSSPSIDVVSTFDNLSNELCKVADLAEFVRVSHPNPDYVKAAESTSFEIGGYVEELNTHINLYRAIQDSLTMHRNVMDDVTKMVAELFIFDFEQSGIHLDKNRREIAVNLHEAILVLGARFSEGTTSPRMHPLNKWPKDVQIPYHIEKDIIVADSVYHESRNPKLRELSMKTYFSHCDKQSHLFENLVFAKNKLASLLGFESYSERVLKGTTASSPTKVVNFLESTLSMLEKPLQKDLNVLKNYVCAFESNKSIQLNAWDLRYYKNLFITQAYNISSSNTKQYFSVGSCMEGLNIIFNSLFGVSLNIISSLPGEIWSPDVIKLEVKHEHEGLLGVIYCDFYQREGKLPQDCHFTIRGGKQLPDGSYQTPIISLYCNFPPPTVEMPSLLTLNMVENIFHEMGHAMHSILGRARYQHITGTRCPTDFAEVPSILMEYFAMDERILPLYAKHYKTGETLPTDIIKKLCTSRKQFSAIDVQTQTFYSLVDQGLYGKRPHGQLTTDFIDNLCKEYSPVSIVPGTSWHLRFNHFYNYAAKYYSYVWSKAVASKIWYSCFEKDPLSRCAGERYREKMLRHGGGKPPQQMVNDMLGSDITVNDLVFSLKHDIEN